MKYSNYKETGGFRTLMEIYIESDGKLILAPWETREMSSKISIEEHSE